VAEKPPRIPPLALVRTINTVRAGVQRLNRVLAPGGLNVMELLTGAWTAQCIYVAVKLGIPDQLATARFRPMRWRAGSARTPMRCTG
jgi:hypothetical protein